MKKEDKEKKVLEFLQAERKRGCGDWYGPTFIGMRVFSLDCSNASSRVASPIKQLLKEGLIERSKGGKYRAVKSD